MGKVGSSAFLGKAIGFLVGFLSRATHALTGHGPSCRFYPSCSQYTQTAFTRWGFFKGFFLSFSRVARCNPWGGSGYHPVPKK